MRNLVFLLLAFAASALALPDFTGYRPDDQPVYEGFTASARAKNANVGIADIEQVIVGNEELLIRIYVGFGQQVYMRGGHPLDLTELHVRPDGLTLHWYPPCPGGPIIGQRDPARVWQVIQDQDLFAIRDSAAYEDYPMVLDGTGYLTQIKTASAYRDFYVSNPYEYQRGDNPRLLAILMALAEEFAGLGCTAPP